MERTIEMNGIDSVTRESENIDSVICIYRGSIGSFAIVLGNICSPFSRDTAANQITNLIRELRANFPQLNKAGELRRADKNFVHTKQRGTRLGNNIFLPEFIRPSDEFTGKIAAHNFYG